MTHINKGFLQAYLAMPIDRNHSSGSDYKKMAATLVDAAEAADVSMMVFCPGLAYETTRCLIDDGVSSLVGANNRMLLTSDVVVLVYDPDIESWGTPLEFEAATQFNKSVILIDLALFNVTPKPSILRNYPLYLRWLISKSRAVVVTNAGELEQAIRTTMAEVAEKRLPG